MQAPDNSQSFNRYSYCLNNPLKYTDPSGELAWFVPVIAGAIIGAYAGASIQSGTAAFWNWNSNAWKGAIVGGIIGATIGYGVSSALASSGGITGLTTTVNGTDQPYPEYYAGFSPHTVTGNSGLSVVLPHELHHLWQSRALNDLFLLNYGLQGLNALLLKGNFVDERNYYEDFVNYYPWWNTKPVWK